MTVTDSAYDLVERLVAERTGLAFGPGRRDGLERGIRRAMERAGIGDPARYGAMLEADARLWDDLVVELTVGETYFFREPRQFDVLSRTAVPELLARRAPGHTLRAWCAGCASGEEAYSLAMLLERDGLGARSHVLATDISPAALEKAERASYRSWSLRGDGADQARPYLMPAGDGFVVADAVRRRVVFRSLNLAHDVYPTLASGTWGMDLILCRNVLIYLGPATVRHVAVRLFASLAEGGWLVTASSDPPLAAEAPFEVVTTEHGIFYRRGPARPREDAPSLDPPVASQVDPPACPAVADPAASPVRDIPVAPVETVDDILAAARDDLARGGYLRVVERTASLVDSEPAAVLHLRARANLDVGGAELASAGAVARHPLSSELHYLRAVLLSELGRDAEAAGAARRAIYLDRSLALAHFFLGSILRRQGELPGARRAFRNALAICEAGPPDDLVPLSDGERAGRLAEAARSQLSWLDNDGEAGR